ncbi:MAG: hypothetical protein WDW36_006364 [Sanguina aurantia]
MEQATVKAQKLGYALGLKNELKGTGVWGFINLKRDTKPKDGPPGGGGGGGGRSESSRDVSTKATTPAPPRSPPAPPAPSPRAPAATRSARALPRALRAPASSSGLRSSVTARRVVL